MNYKKFTSTILLSGMLLSTNTTVLFADEKGASYETHGVVEFEPNEGTTDPVDPTDPDPEKPVDPVDPTDPEKPVTPGTNGPLSIDYASSFDFGVNKISNKNETYYARAQKYRDGHADTPNFVQISDNRGINAGWTLNVKQEGQFKATTETLNKELKGAQITLNDPKVSSNATDVKEPKAVPVTLNGDGTLNKVMAAEENAGAGTWAAYWGEVEKAVDGSANTENITKAVALTVPGSTPKDAVKYQTTLTWVLSDVPAN